MTALSLTFLALAVCAPLVVGLVSMMTQIHVARDRKSRTGKGWDARDTFEVKDAALGAAVMMLPIAAAFAFVDAKLELPSWQWWSVLLAIGVISAPFSMRYGKWSTATRQRIEATIAPDEASKGGDR
jgi:amino acid transporter